MRRRLLTWLHDSSFWSDYRPTVPAPVVTLGTIGALAVVGSPRLRRGRHRAASRLAAAIGLAAMSPAVVLGVLTSYLRRNRAQIRAGILDAVEWSPSAWVLDVGCGTGMLLNGAALRVPQGRAVGIDIWDPHAGGGTLDVLMANARAEGVAERVEIKYADARSLPFADGLFDIVLCGGAVHHIIRDRSDLEGVLGEMVRVLKPGGRLVIWDVPHMVEVSAAILGEMGVASRAAELVAFAGFHNSLLVATRTAAVQATA